MRSARWVFAIAGVYGLLVLAPMLGMETQVGREYPPVISHPEYFYGFVGVALAWQVGFLVIAADPARYRLMMLPAILEKASFGITVAALKITRDAPTPIVIGASVDVLLMVLFIACWFATKPVGDPKLESNVIQS